MWFRLGGQMPLPAELSRYPQDFGYLIVQGYLIIKDKHCEARVSEVGAGAGACPQTCPPEFDF